MRSSKPSGIANWRNAAFPRRLPRTNFMAQLGSMRAVVALTMAAALLWAQNPTPPRPAPGSRPNPAPGPPPTSDAQAPALRATQDPTTGALNLNGASLIEVVDILARDLKINYILDPRVNGKVTVNTYGELKSTDIRQMLETILRINGAALVQVGDLYRIVPLTGISQLPIAPRVNGKDLPQDESTILNLVFLKYATAPELSKVLEPFLGESAKLMTYEPGNLLLILDNSRNMRRTMELIEMFDNDTLAGQRVRLFDVTNGRPSDISKELETIFKAVSMSEKAGSIKFMPIDRINT